MFSAESVPASTSIDPNSRYGAVGSVASVGIAQSDGFDARSATYRRVTITWAGVSISILGVAAAHAAAIAAPPTSATKRNFLTRNEYRRALSAASHRLARNARAFV